MALPKLFNRIFWHNNTTPAINEDNLNSMSKAIDDIDNRVIDLADSVTQDIPELEEDIEEVRQLVNDADALKTQVQGYAKYWAENTNWTIADDQWAAIVAILS